MSVVSEFFEKLPSRVEPGKTAGMNNSYVFAIDGAGTWTVRVADGGVTVEDGDAHSVLNRARDVLTTRYGIAHATLQVEPADHTGCDELAW